MEDLDLRGEIQGLKEQQLGYWRTIDQFNARIDELESERQEQRSRNPFHFILPGLFCDEGLEVELKSLYESRNSHEQLLKGVESRIAALERELQSNARVAMQEELDRNLAILSESTSAIKKLIDLDREYEDLAKIPFFSATTVRAFKQVLSLLEMDVMFNHDGIFSALSVISQSLAAIVGDQYNATFSLTEPSGTVVTRDPDTGNYTIAGITPVEIKAQVKAEKDPNTSSEPGINYTRLYLEGQIIDPFVYPKPLPRRIQASVLYQGIWRSGYFYPVEMVEDMFNTHAGFEDALGQRIKGYFEMTEGN